MDVTSKVTLLLRRISAEEQGAEEELFPLIYEELRGLAGSLMRRERPDHTLQATALVHEAFIRLAGPQGTTWQDRAHFFATAASVMRRILIDHARKRCAGKRGLGATPVLLDEERLGSNQDLERLICIDEALTHLAKQDERQARIVEMRFFGGMTEEEIGLLLDLSPRTVKRDWVVAKVWLQAELRSNRKRSNNSSKGAAS